MLRVLVLEDSKMRISIFQAAFIGVPVTFVETAEKAIKELKANQYDMVFLDHDLGGQEMVKSGPGTGWEVAKWMSDQEYEALAIIHSCNHPGATAMKALLPEAVIIPFPTLRPNLSAAVEACKSMNREELWGASETSQDGSVREVRPGGDSEGAGSAEDVH